MTTMEIITAALALLTLCLSLLLCLHTHRRERENRARWMRRQQNLETEIAKLRGSVTELRQQLSEQVTPPYNPSPPRGFANPINLNRRSEAIRMFRRGESPESVAQLLGCPKQEAILLLKVYRTITTLKTVEPKAATHAPALQPPQPQPARAVFPSVTQEEANNAATII